MAEPIEQEINQVGVLSDPERSGLGLGGKVLKFLLSAVMVASLAAACSESEETEAVTDQTTENTADDIDSTTIPIHEEKSDTEQLNLNSLREVLPLVLDREYLMQQLNPLPGERVVTDEYRDFNPEESRGLVSDYSLIIGSDDLMFEGNYIPITGFTVTVTDKEILESVSNEEEGGPVDPPYGSLEREAQVFDATRLTIESGGHTFDAITNPGWVMLDMGENQVYIGYTSGHPDRGEERQDGNPFSDDGDITPAWQPVVDNVVRGLLGDTSASPETPTTTNPPAENDAPTLPPEIPPDLSPGEIQVDEDGFMWQGQESGPPINIGQGT